MKGKESLIVSLIIILGGLGLAWLLRPIDNGLARLEFLPSRKRQFVNKPTLSDELMADEYYRIAWMCVCQYIDAYNEGLPDAELEKIKDGFKKEFGYIIYQDEKLRLCVKDLQDAPVLKYTD